MAHVLIVGTTESGKSSLARALAASYGAGRIVLDPMRHPEWECDRLFDTGPEFLACARQAQGCALFVDEAPHVIGRYDSEMHWLATQARHRGHWSHFVAQHYKALPPPVRDQCTLLFLFRVPPDTADALARDFTQPELLEATQLGQGEFIQASRFGGCERKRLFTPSRGG